MEVLKGIVSNSQSTASVQGGQRTSTRTWQIASFLVNGRPATFTAMFPIIVNNGDEIVVAGKASARGLKCRAYRNITNGTYGDSRGTAMIVFGLVCLLIGLLFLFAAPAGVGLFGFLVFSVFWVPSLWFGLQTKRARRLCMSS
jgi:hypothetical protein